VPQPIHIEDLAAPRLPWWLALGNALGRPLAGRIALREDALCEAASRSTGGLTDFGDSSFREPLRVLLASFEREAGLSPFGRLATQRLLVQLLASRLLIEDTLRRHPEILDQPVARPIVIAGLPRTGTTHLHNLVSRAPELRSLPYWESLEPLPSPRDRHEPGRPDPRVARCERGLTFLHKVMPLFPSMHEMTWDAVHEEIQLLALQFSTMLFESSYRVPSYREWYKGADQRPAYAYLRRVLQVLQWLRGPQRWILKSPQHLEQIGPLIETFPDAFVVQTHRDPVRITASLCTMIAYGMRMNAARVDPREVGSVWSARVEDLLRGSVEQRPLLPPAQVMDLRFHEFMKDEVAGVQRVFAFAGQPWTEAAEEAIRRYMDASPRGRHGSIDYRLEDVGLDARERRAALRFYQERFAVPEE
jgi:hypothetical protein